MRIQIQQIEALTAVDEVRLEQLQRKDLMVEQMFAAVVSSGFEEEKKEEDDDKMERMFQFVIDGFTKQRKSLAQSQATYKQPRAIVPSTIYFTWPNSGSLSEAIVSFSEAGGVKLLKQKKLLSADKKSYIPFNF